ncbi:GntR family transcriptional regulator [Actinomadura rupiterrae]|uniref:GntR family transcriptional regulator n=1 Tax=Actinomadura rupiterrae TaxID=559627 RepID=UPI0020A53311|nr:GntR family transcriptional regulator [Actinomadura rupiterrae]MCP2335366.1 GntR family transcriptional regulator [Actinomadura rupiterrae]
MPARYEEIAADLRERISSGELRPGQRLPTERELALRYDASRNTVRDAVLRLRGLRLLESRHGLGTFVLEPPVKFAITLTPSEGTGSGGGEGRAWVDEVARQQRSARTSVPSVAIEQADEPQARELGIGVGDMLVVRHQQHFITDKGVDVPWSLRTSFYPIALVDRGATRLQRPEDIPEGTAAYLEQTLGIRQAGYRDRIWVRPPNDYEIRFFDMPPEGTVPVFVHQRVVTDTEGEPCRYTLTVYPADRNEFVIEADLPARDG